MNVRLVHITTVPQSLSSFFPGQMRYMTRWGFEVHAISSPGPRLDEFGRDEGIQVHAVPLSRSITPGKDLVALFRLVRLLRQIRPHIVHAHTPKAGLLGMLVARLLGIQVRVYHIHGLPHMTARGPKRILLILSERLSVRLANRVLCVSRSIGEVIVSQGICCKRKIRTLGNGTINGIDAALKFNPERIDRQRLAEFRASVGLGKERRVLGFVGRVARDKGIVELFHAWNILKANRDDLELLIVGPLEQNDPVPAAVLEAMKNDERIHFTGALRDVALAYASMDILILPTYREGFGLVAAEAASMRLPVIATDIPGCRDAILDGTTGTLVCPKSSDAIVAAVQSYLDDPQLCIRHGTAGRARIMEKFQPEGIWKAQLEEYEHLLQKQKAFTAAADLTG